MPATEEEEWGYWDAQATRLVRTEVETVNASATRLAALTASLLGLFGAVAFAGGLTTLDKLTSPLDDVVRVMTTAAVLAAAVGTVLLAAAAGSLGVKNVSSLNGPKLKELSQEQARKQRRLLSKGRLAAALAAALVISGSLLVLWAGTSPPSAASRYLVVHDDGAACGELATTAEGEVVVAGIPLTGDVHTVLSVASCPEP